MVGRIVHLLRVRVRVQTRHQVEDVAERHRVQVLDERWEEVVYVAAAVFQLETGRNGNVKSFACVLYEFRFWLSGSLQRFVHPGASNLSCSPDTVHVLRAESALGSQEVQDDLTLLNDL